MGLGAYLAAVTERDHYFSEEKRERDEVLNKSEDEKLEIHEILERYGVGREACTLVVKDLESNPESWVQVSTNETLLLSEINSIDVLVYDGLRTPASQAKRLTCVDIRRDHGSGLFHRYVVLPCSPSKQT